VYSSNINNLKDHDGIKEVFHAPMKTIVTFSIVTALIVLLFASGTHKNQQIYAVNTGNVGHLYEGGIPGYPYFGGYPNYGGYPYITGYGHPYNGDHSYDYGYGGYPYITGYGHPYTFFHHHHHHHHHTH
jgi:hypothetical protein